MFSALQPKTPNFHFYEFTVALFKLTMPNKLNIFNPTYVRRKGKKKEVKAEVPQGQFGHPCFLCNCTWDKLLIGRTWKGTNYCEISRMIDKLRVLGAVTRSYFSNSLDYFKFRQQVELNQRVDNWRVEINSGWIRPENGCQMLVVIG